MKNYFKNESSPFFEHHVKIARVDVSKNKWFAEIHPNIQTFPNWVMYIKGDPYYIPNHHIATRFIMHLNRMLNPYATISSLQSYDQFMQHSKKDKSGRHLIRNKVVGLFMDAEDFEEQIEIFKKTALMTYWREDTIYALCTHPLLVKQIYGKYGTKHLPNQYDKNTIFMLNMKNRFAKREKMTHIDFSKVKDLSTWLAQASISPLEEMTSLNQRSFSTNAPLLVAFVDPNNEAVTQSFLDELEDLGTKYINRVNFVWVDYKDNLLLMKRLGVEGVRLPCVGLESPHHLDKTFVLRESKPTGKKIDEFLDGFFSGTLQSEESKRIQGEMKESEEQIQMLNRTKSLNLLEYHAFLNDNNFDGLIYFFNSSQKTDRQTNRSLIVDHMSKFMKNSAQLDSMLVISYDIGRYRLPEEFFNDPEFSVNSVYMKKASQTEGPFLRFKADDETFTSENLLKFTLLNAEIRHKEDQKGMEFDEEDDHYFHNKEDLFTEDPGDL